MNRNLVLDNISYLCHLISFLFCLHMVLSQFAKYNYCIYVVWFHRAYHRLVIVVLKDLKTKPASKTAPISLSKTLKTGKKIIDFCYKIHFLNLGKVKLKTEQIFWFIDRFFIQNSNFE
jgi:hypothetical protein